MDRKIVPNVPGSEVHHGLYCSQGILRAATLEKMVEVLSVLKTPLKISVPLELLLPYRIEAGSTEVQRRTMRSLVESSNAGMGSCLRFP